MNGSDYTLIDDAFNAQRAELSASDVYANITVQIAGNTAVPEPAMINLLVIAVAGMLGRRRKMERK